jgi:hypothetical protein
MNQAVQFPEPQDAEEATRRQEYADYKRWVDHVTASMELVLFPAGCWSDEARRIKAFRERQQVQPRQ